MTSRRPKRQTKRKHPSDQIEQSSKSSNWFIKTLKIELQKLEINVPNGLSKTVLHQLYLENVKPKVVEDVSSGNNNIDMEMTSDQDVSLVRDSTQITTPFATMNAQSLIEQSRAQDPGHTSSTIPLGGNDNQMTSILGALTSVTQCFTGLQDTVNQFAAPAVLLSLEPLLCSS
jgi:chromosomal replication initiation ATPase DnaA